MKIAVSTLSIKENRRESILKLGCGSTDYIHLDVMDGKFVSNKVEYLDVKEALFETKKPFDIHLMVTDLNDYIEKYKNFSPKYMSFHIEATENPNLYIDKIKKFAQVGLAINPKTEIEVLLPYLNQVDLVLVMSVEPGKGGQKFIDITDKIQFLKQYKEKHQLDFKIEVDGGINDTTINKVRDCDLVVVGSYITNAMNFEQQIRNLVN